MNESARNDRGPCEMGTTLRGLPRVRQWNAWWGSCWGAVRFDGATTPLDSPLRPE